MPWDKAHRSVLYRCLKGSSILFKDFPGFIPGNPPTVADNSFAKRLGEMMGEEVVNSAWTDEMEKHFLNFFLRFYQFPDELSIEKMGYRPKFKNPKWANELQTGKQSLSLIQEKGKSRLHKTIEGEKYPGSDEDVVAVKKFFKLWLLRGFIPVSMTHGSQMTKKPAIHFVQRFAKEVPNDGKIKSIPELINACVSTIRGPWRFAWRGDSRQWKDMIAANGLHSKVISNSKVYLDKTNLVKPWHIFSEDRFRNHMYFRRQQKDNCLDTCVSISIIGYNKKSAEIEFKTNACFPQLCLIDKKWRKKAYVKYRNTKGDLITAKKYLDTVRLYFMSLPAGTTYFDTGKAQDLWGSPVFPECAVRGVRAVNVLGYITYVRVHHGNGDEMDEAFDAIPIKHKNYTNLRRSPKGAEELFKKAVSCFTRAWAPDGSVEKPTDIKQYIKISEVTLERYLTQSECLLEKIPQILK